jgi:type IV pilus assembly protein PilQ
VVDDEAGNPLAVTLDVKITANDVDQSNVTQGIPAITQRAIQTQLLLGPDKTAILGGFTVDSDQKSVSRTPGLSYIPLLGELFKRRTRNTQVNRLYFALSVEVIPYGQAIEPVSVPGATTQPPSVTPKQLDRSNKAEPKQVVTPKPKPSPDH